MNNKGMKCYADKKKEIFNKVDSLNGCVNRMCVTDDYDELLRMLSYLNLYASDLYRLNRQRLYFKEHGDKELPAIDL